MRWKLGHTNDSSEYYTNVTGKICITRYGQVFRGNKAKNAEDAGKLLTNV